MSYGHNMQFNLDTSKSKRGGLGGVRAPQIFGPALTTSSPSQNFVPTLQLAPQIFRPSEPCKIVIIDPKTVWSPHLLESLIFELI